MVMDVCDHPDHHMPTTEFHGGKEIGSSVEKPQTTKTGKAKNVKFPFKGANS